MATWLDQVNNIRAMAKPFPQSDQPGAHLNPVTEDPALSDACRQLAQYEVENLPGLSHLDGQKANPNFTAGQNSNLWGSGWRLGTDIDIINQWGLSVFHGLSMLDPRLNKVGFGSYSTTDPNRTLKAVAALNVFQGVNGAVPPASWSPSGAWSSTEPWPWQVVFPCGLISAHANTYASETPDARASTQCSYTGLAGLPISVQVASLGGVEVRGNCWLKYEVPGTPTPPTNVEICIIDQNNFTNSDSLSQNLGRGILSYRGAVVLLPRLPLSAGFYTAHIEIKSPNTPISIGYEWSFLLYAGETLPAVS
jgi:hypothetical protein